MHNTFPQAVRILSVIRKGSSMPVVVEADNGQRYLVKLRGSLSSPVATLCDWLACTMGLAIGLPIVQPIALIINPTTDNSGVDIEMRDLITKSMGVNIAFPFYDDAVDFRTDTNGEYSELLARLFVFDIFLLNIDRQTTNTNILLTEKRLLAFDYESSFLLMALLNNATPSYNTHMLQQLRNSPLFSENAAGDLLQQELWKLQDVDIEQLVNTIPEEWLLPFTTTPHDYTHTIAQRIQTAVHNEEWYAKLVEELVALPKETDEQRKQKALENRRRFEKKFLS